MSDGRAHEVRSIDVIEKLVSALEIEPAELFVKQPEEGIKRAKRVVKR